MHDTEIQVTPDTLVASGGTVTRLVDVINSTEEFCLWAIPWNEVANGITSPDGISFHRSSKEAREFVKVLERDKGERAPLVYSTPAGPAKFIEVSECIYNHVQDVGFYWADFNNMNEAKFYGVRDVKSLN